MTCNPVALPQSAAERVLEMAKDDPELLGLMPDPAVEATRLRPELGFAEVVSVILNGYAERPALSTRAYKVRSSAGRNVREYLPSFESITYAELHDRVKGLVNAWRDHERHHVEPGELVCILGFTGPDQVVAELACAYRRAVSVPLQSTMAKSDLEAIIAHTTASALVATVDVLVTAAELATSQPSVRSVVAIDYDDRVDGDREQFAAAQAILEDSGSSAELISLDALVDFGRRRSWDDAVLARQSDDDERVATLVHSSGTTGTPKGAIFLGWQAKAFFTSGGPPIPVVKLCFAPMGHTAGLSHVFGTLSRGGTAYFTAKSDLSTLFEDMRLARPTELYVFPRVLETIHLHYQNEVHRRMRGGDDDFEKVSAEVMEEMGAEFLGDRLSQMTVGSAPTTPEVLEFVTACFPVPLTESYGSTEAGRVTVNGQVSRPPVIDYKLRDVPELGYYSSDQPYPRGELCVKTETRIVGYFNRPDATAALFDDDGYLLTGDIMEERGPDHLVYIDRRNDVIKLAQGEFVAAGALGAAFENGSDVVHQIYVDGNSTRPYLLAVVVPNPDAVTHILGEDASQAAVKALVRTELNRVAGDTGLRAFEVPRDFIVETEPFSLENGLLNALRKRIRPRLQQRYGEQLEQLASDLERRQREELHALRNAGSELSVLQKVGKALEASLGVADLDVDKPQSFAELGGDSLGATAFSALLEEIFGVEVQVSDILSPAGNPRQWAMVIEAGLADEAGATATFAKIHGKGATRLEAKDLDIAAFLDADTLERVPTEAPPDQSEVVLLTGANGFLGRFLCLEWLERLAVTGGKLICLVRATDQPTAAGRLATSFEGGDSDLERRFHALADNHLEVVAGDVAQPRLGLDAAEFDRLASEVDRIVHPAALVNHVLDYEYLFGPNVAGTAELVRLALTTRQKRFDFVSSLAAVKYLEGGKDESSPLSQTIRLSTDYGSGYGASKWAAEQLLHSANRRFGLPVNVFRGNMMLPHRRFHKQINVSDIFTRLLYSVITTRLAPASFYGLEPGGNPPKAHYDGLPVDFIAAAVVGIGADPHRDIRTFHVMNYHGDDGISLDTFVDWARAAGYPVERVADYGAWLQQFEAKLQALPEEKRRHSSLSVIESLREPQRTGLEVNESKYFQDALAGLPTESTAPHLTEEFIDKCLDDLCELGLLAPPVN